MFVGVAYGSGEAVVLFVHVVPGGVFPDSGGIAEEERAARTLSHIVRFARSASEFS